MALSDSLKLRRARWSPAVEILLSSSPSVQINAATQRLTELGQNYEPLLLDAGELRQDVGLRTITTYRFGLRSSSVLALDMPALLAQYPVLGATVTLRVFFEGPDGTVENVVLFVGVVNDFTVTPSGVQFRAEQVALEELQIPVRQIMPDSMEYGTTEGVEPKGQRGVVSPIFYGFFDLRALSRAADEFPWQYNEWRGPHFTPMLGLVTPCIPLVLLSDLFQWPNDGTAVDSTAKRLLFARGDTENTDNTRIFSSPVVFIPQVGTERDAHAFHYTTMFTWDQETDRAVMFVKDNSDYLNDAKYGAEKARAGASVWTIPHGHTNKTSPNQWVQAWDIQRTDPVWPKPAQAAPEFFSGRCKSIALLPDSLSKNSNTTDTQLFGTLGTLNPGNAIDFTNAFTNYAELATATDRLSIQMPAQGPRLGEVIAVRMIVVFGALPVSGHALRAAYRFHPFTNGLEIDPEAEFSCTQLTAGSAHVIEHLQSDSPLSWMSFYVWTLNRIRFGHTVPQWFFVEQAGSPAQAWAGDLVIWDTGASATEKTKIYCAWMDVVYRDNVGAASKVPGTGGSQLVSRFGNRDVWGRRSVPVRSRYERTAYIGNVVNEEEQLLSSQTLYITAESQPYLGTNDRWKPGRVAASETTSIHNPASVALHLIDKYLGDYANCETAAATFGSFRGGMEHLEAIGTWPAYRLSVLVDKRDSLRNVLNRLGANSRSYFARQYTTAGAYKWRMFVDSYDPALDFPERLWRAGETIKVQDVFEISVDMTPLDQIRTAFVLRYGFHPASGRFAYEKILNKDQTDLATGGADYKAACDTAEQAYGGPVASGLRLKREEIIELPWVWFDEVADDQLKYHCNLSRQRRASVKLTGGANLLDVVPGHVVYLENDFVTVLGAYPGLLPNADWDCHQWHVIGRDVKMGRRGLQVELSLIENLVVPPAV